MQFSRLATWALALRTVTAQTYSGPEDSRLETALILDVPTNGVSTTPSGRLFLVLARVDGSKGAQVVEYNQTTRSMTAYPNEEWNSYADGKDPSTHLVRINSQRVGPDGKLYLVDVGSPSFGAPVIFPDGPKLIQVDLEKNEVSRIFWMGNVTRYNSLLDDVRFNLATGKAYLTDAGSPGLIVLDLASGISQRVLEAYPGSTQGVTPVSAEGQYLVQATNGEFEYIHADQLEVSPDGKWFYFQPSNGGMSRIETKWLDQSYYNSSLAGAVLETYVQPFSLTPSTGGTAIDANGCLYVSDTDSQRIIKVDQSGKKTLVVQDPRLLWIDAMWIDSNQKLWMPAAQLNRGTPFGNGEVNLTKPLHAFTLDIGVGPSPIDHA